MNIAIITGASSGMGKEFVIQADANYVFDEIWVIARRKERLEELQALVKTKIVPVPLDLTDNSSLTILAEKLKNETPNVKLLVNCSGYGKFGLFENSTLEDNAGMIDLNLKALITVTQTVLPYIKEGGKIIELGSISGFMPIAHVGVYAASKAGVLSFSEALAKELKPKKIKVLCVCPYWVKTEFFDRADEKEHVKKYDVMYEPAFIVKKAYKTIDKTNKHYVVPGAYAKLVRFLAKILPHKLMMAIINAAIKFEK